MTPREILIKKQDFHKKRIKELEAEIANHDLMVTWLEEAIDAIDMAEAEMFDKANS